MKLYIDTSSLKTIKVCLEDTCQEVQPIIRASQSLLPLIMHIIEKRKSTYDAITQIVVTTSGESYTGLRVGMTVAQTLGWALSVPVNGIVVSNNVVPLTYNTNKE